MKQIWFPSSLMRFPANVILARRTNLILGWRQIVEEVLLNVGQVFRRFSVHTAVEMIENINQLFYDM